MLHKKCTFLCFLPALQDRVLGFVCFFLRLLG